jgi:phage baseplate assembly protein W
MFLERKFMSPGERRERLLAAGPLAALPEEVRDVAQNLSHLLAAERGIGHVLPDFGFSRSGHWSAEGLLTHCSRELRENLRRYEPRFALVDIEAELDADGHPALLVLGRVVGVSGLVSLTLDPIQRRICAVRIA